MARIVLVGAGHAHLEVARRGADFVQAAHDLLLIDPDCFWYSGLATGMLGGMYEPADDVVDARRLIEDRGGRFLQGRVVGLDRAQRTVALESGETIAYDVLSFNVGSQVRAPVAPGAHVWTVKPIRELARLRRQIEGWGGQRQLELLVIGGGPTGCEIAANLAALCRRRGLSARIVLLASGSRLLADFPRPASKRVAALLRGLGVELLLEERLVRLEGMQAVTGSGAALPFDELVLATGLKAGSWLVDLGLPVDESRGLKVNGCLQSLGDPRVFAVGDCADIQGRALPRLGVFGVRAAPVLAANLIRRADGDALDEYHPQHTALAILNLGDGRGLALWWRLWWCSRLAMRWKDHIDRKFLRRYR